MAETSYNGEGAQLYQNGQSESQTVTVPANAGGYLDAFISEICGESGDDSPTTNTNLRAARVALRAQDAAEAENSGFDL